MSETELVRKILKPLDERAAKLEAAVAMLTCELERLKSDVEGLKTIKTSTQDREGSWDEPALPDPGEFERWIESDGAKAYAYKHIAYVLGEGVIGSADTLDDLVATIATHPKQEEAILDFVIGDRI